MQVALQLGICAAPTDLPVVNTWRRGAFELAFDRQGGCATLDRQSDGLIKVTSTCQFGTDGLPFTQTDTFQWTPPPAQMTLAELGVNYDTLWWEGGSLNVSSVLSTTNVGQPPRACVSQKAWQTSHPADTYATGVGAPPCSYTQPAAVLALKARRRRLPPGPSRRHPSAGVQPGNHRADGHPRWGQRGLLPLPRALHLFEVGAK